MKVSPLQLYLAMLRGYNWLYTQDSILVVVWGTHLVPGIKLGMVTCKTSALLLYYCSTLESDFFFKQTTKIT